MTMQDQIDDATTIIIGPPHRAIVDTAKLGDAAGAAFTLETNATGKALVRVSLDDGSTATTSLGGARRVLDALVSFRWKVRRDTSGREVIRSRKAPSAGGASVTVARVIAAPLAVSERIAYADGNPRNLLPENIVIHRGGASETLAEREARRRLN